MWYIINGSITNFEPDDTEQEFYIEASYQDIPIAEIILKAKEKWGQDINIENLCIRPENIHTHCIYYASYDSGDYTDYLVISKFND